MKRRIIIIAVLLFGLFFIAKRKIKLSKAPVFGNKPIVVSVFYTKKGDINVYRDYLAEVEPINTAKISTRISALVDEVFVDEGAEVKKGDLLAKLDEKDILAKIDAAKESLSSAEENYNYWKKEYERDENLFKQGAISEEARDRAKNMFAASKAKLESAKKAIEILKVNLKYTDIKSPYDGVVSRRFVDPGDLAVPGKPLFVVENRSRFKLAFDIPQEDVGTINKGALISFKVGKKSFNAKITNKFPSIEKGRMLRIEAYLDNKCSLVSGAFVPVRVILASKKDVVILPKSAISKGQGKKPFVFVVKDKKLVRYPVKIGLISDNFAEVKNIAVGVPVVKNPYLSWVKLAEGQTVKMAGAK